MKILKKLLLILMILTGCKVETLTPIEGFDLIMEQAAGAQKKDDFKAFQSLYTEKSDTSIIKQDYELDYAAFERYDKKLVSVIEQLDNNYLLACSHYSVKNGNVDQMTFTVVLEEEGNNWKLNYDPQVVQKLNAKLAEDAYPKEMLETDRAVTFDAPFFYLDDNAVYEDCVQTSILNLWEKDQMYCQIWVTNGYDYDIELKQMNIRVMDTEQGMLADDTIEIKKSLKAGKSNVWILPVQTLQNVEWTNVGVDYSLDWEEIVSPAK